MLYPTHNLTIPISRIRSPITPNQISPLSNRPELLVPMRKVTQPGQLTLPAPIVPANLGLIVLRTCRRDIREIAIAIGIHASHHRVHHLVVPVALALTLTAHVHWRVHVGHGSLVAVVSVAVVVAVVPVDIGVHVWIAALHFI